MQKFGSSRDSYPPVSPCLYLPALKKSRRISSYSKNEKKVLNSLIEVDGYPGGEWTLSAEFAQLFILGYDDRIRDDRNQMLATFSVSKNLLRDTLTLSTFVYIGINDSELFNRSSADYELADGLHLEAGIDVFAGDEGIFGQYEDNTEVWLKAKYSF